MIRFLLYLLLLSPVIYASLWLTDHPGNITLDWLGYRIETSLAVVIAVLLLVLFSVAALVLVLRIVFVLPRNVSSQRRYSKQTCGIEALTLTMSAIAIADYKMAEKHLLKAQKLLGNDAAPTLILKAQMAAATGQKAQSTAPLLLMLEHKETRQIGLRGLLTQSLKDHQIPEALTYAKEAFAMQPSDRFVALCLLNILLQKEAWDEVEQTLLKAVKHKAILAKEKKHILAILYFPQAKKAVESKLYGKATALLEQAEKHDPSFSPARTWLMQNLVQTQDKDAYLRSIRRLWKRYPSLHYLDDLTTLFVDEKKSVLAKMLQKLAALNPEHPDSLHAQARAAMLLENYALARDLLRKTLEQRESAAAYEWLAELEKKESGNLAAAANWLKQAVHAPKSGFWQCGQCGHLPKEWLLQCPSCSAFDAALWIEPDPIVLIAH